ncbi:alanyl-tRNA synthetase [Arachidicoccus rhizosphaerae]|uniref:Alanine--tRNA ligase n=1 Tax=Arachidicoccus rhizosphaerae TaxID=551991 RepID=A0A1H4AEN2_9BACT|nr:alanine--tRNA ligase [Arachidicoccus rhizosphaerae]SEA34449.1 alanyl-tRNA synthetase [Arachidicoccus rhizosphaerae]
MTSAAIRQQFLDFFKEKQHTIVPSAPIVIKNDPTLLFTNAGMNQFKDYFLGNKVPAHRRVADTQKCLRVSGKHNDLEEVGVDTYHHTMFEMLGNWSFGDYFKKEAIAWSWELLTGIFKINPGQIYVTVFEGDESEGLPFDQEAYDEWAKWVDPAHILKGNKKDNFWEMGDTGPCGPCSEIHMDCRTEAERAGVSGASLVNADHPQVIEIWNNVFMQFNRGKDGSLTPLPEKHVDTGMGFERLVRVLQQKTSNYDTDVFTGTIQVISQLTGKKYSAADSRQDIAFRVLADHIRAIAFSIADGQLPSNTGAGYVIRRILRRAVRYYYSYLDYKTPLLFQLVPVIAKQFDGVFPELVQQQDFVTKVIKEEEEAFLRTLEKGLKKIDELIQTAKTSGLSTLDGAQAFELYDTFGFPIDLTRLIASENELSVDEAGFAEQMQQQKNRSRAATALDTEDWVPVHPTDKTGFVGYDDLLVPTEVVKYRKVKSKNKETYQLVLKQTPFYAESGGQVGDTGVLVFGDEKIPVENTKKENGEFIHFVQKLPAAIDGEVIAKVDGERRLNTTYNHTATHLLHAALKQVLGTHVNQKGSLVSPEVLRFDVSHFAKITDEELMQVEAIVNEKIRANIEVNIEELPKEEALKKGAMALFGEKYGDLVRVVTIDPAFSIELCGGTHVPRTGMIGLMVITAESAVAAGVRRIEALTGGAAIRYFADKVQQNKAVAEILKTNQPIKAIEKLLEEKAALESKLASLEAKEITQLATQLLAKTQTVNGVQFIGEKVEVSSADNLKKLAFALKSELKDYVVVLTASVQGKASVVIITDPALQENKGLDINAGQLIKKTIAPIIKGGGGGSKDLATAGGQDASNLDQVIAAVSAVIAG